MKVLAIERLQLCKPEGIEFVYAVLYTYSNGKDRVYFGPVARTLN